MSWREFLEKNVSDIASVISVTERDANGVHYSVEVSLHSLVRHAFEQGEDRVSIWENYVEFGQSAGNSAGGSAFVFAAREQEEIAATIGKTLRKERSE